MKWNMKDCTEPKCWCHDPDFAKDDFDPGARCLTCGCVWVTPCPTCGQYPKEDA